MMISLRQQKSRRLFYWHNMMNVIVISADRIQVIFTDGSEVIQEVCKQ